MKPEKQSSPSRWPKGRKVGGRSRTLAETPPAHAVVSPNADPSATSKTNRWTPPELLRWTSAYFSKHGLESPRLEAELLLAGALEQPRIKLYTDFDRPVSEEARARFREFVRRRAEKREPLQYILGHAEFMGLTLKVTPETLIPRPETEELALWAIDRLREAAGPGPRGALFELLAAGVPSAEVAAEFAEEHKSAGEPPSPSSDAPVNTAEQKAPGSSKEEQAEATAGAEVLAADLGTGCGCLALALARYVPSARVWATDVFEATLAAAAENVAALPEGKERLTVCRGDLFAALPDELRGRLTLVVSNPPYVSEKAAATLPPEVREHEPTAALFAGEDGLAILCRLCAEVGAWLTKSGWFGTELGEEQGAAVRRMLEETDLFDEVEIRRDFAGRERFALARRRS